MEKLNLTQQKLSLVVLVTAETDLYRPEDEEAEDVAMGDEYLMRRSSDGRVWSVEVLTKRCLQPRTVHVVRLRHHHHHHHQYQHHHHSSRAWYYFCRQKKENVRNIESFVVIADTPFTRYNRLSNGFDNRLNVCIHDTTGCHTGLTTGCIV